MAIFDLNNTFGAFLIGTVVSAMLFGVTVTQTWYYFQNYSDGILVQAVVPIILVAETLHIVFCIHAIYHYVILSFGEPQELMKVIWTATASLTVTSVIVVVVQLFYAWRIYAVSRKNIGVTAFVVILALARFGVGIAFSVTSFERPFFQDFEQHQAPLIDAALGMSVVTDAFIAASLSYYLHTSRSGVRSTDTLINKLIIFSINNGLLTSVFDIVILISATTQRNALIFLAILEVVGNLYSNSMLATLNSRRSTIKSMLPTAVELSGSSSAFTAANGSLTMPRGSAGAVETKSQIFGELGMDGYSRGTNHSNGIEIHKSIAINASDY
ncbi:hypothetical protein BDZ97DRAFT_1916495 [Flammula alnicola]|nr:hypothetical protein BDZ97DRAFT_1916495 [Flammula alnicola]